MSDIKNKCKTCGISIDYRSTYCKKHFATEEVKLKMSNAKTGKASWNKGIKGTHHLSEEAKKKFSLIAKKNGFGKWMKGRKISKEICKKRGESIRKTLQKNKDKRKVIKGKLHWNWKGGLSRNKHYSYEARKWRSDVFQRDNWTCQTCGIRGCYLEAHHIKSWANYPELRYNIDNGITLCNDCHKLTDNYKGKSNR